MKVLWQLNNNIFWEGGLYGDVSRQVPYLDRQLFCLWWISERIKTPEI